MASEADEGASEAQCAVCGQEVEPQQSHIAAECSICGRLDLHSWCATKYTGSRIRMVHTNSKGIEKGKLTAKAKPWRQLEHMRLA
ncbi:hypothetical protein CHLNCDRAFT_134382 [Chlorella variabilis]|uniref:Uncharacterized protein n=1 Tax=Chlorella variabilis TaxID=554065 RepID=E1ZFW1_CHLVA|nr:hypothetical protein CHLNCDRAFT_134382 [Chlorella variabilis]EFN55355.1 hypothetical protein CHLNCDRAFT_134382 [Chlorella variabilis]|eukprot:XP_005847457.1 hypothetical protein CHLNCDRAFT_134382 [Chlorella variabilis]